MAVTGEVEAADHEMTPRRSFALSVVTRKQRYRTEGSRVVAMGELCTTSDYLIKGDLPLVVLRGNACRQGKKVA
jgi:hypothetical protein